MRKTNLLLLALSASTFLLLSGNAYAFTYDTCTTSSGSQVVLNQETTSNNPSVIFASATIPYGSAQFNALITALTAINKAPANISFQGVIHSAGADNALVPAWDVGSKYPPAKPGALEYVSRSKRLNRGANATLALGDTYKASASFPKI